jgi:hypothetical protein
MARLDPGDPARRRGDRVRAGAPFEVDEDDDAFEDDAFEDDADGRTAPQLPKSWERERDRARGASPARVIEWMWRVENQRELRISSLRQG